MGIDDYEIISTDDISRAAADRGFGSVRIQDVKDFGPNSHVFRAKEYVKNKYGVTPDDTWSNVTGDTFAEARDAMDSRYRRPTDILAVHDPARIRSRFAAFDPFRKESANLLASGLLGSLLLNPREE